MDADIVTRLEKLVDELLARLKTLEVDRERLSLEREALVGEQQRIRGELDRILVKLEAWERDLP